jgi:hypothetical protein
MGERGVTVLSSRTCSRAMTVLTEAASSNVRKANPRDRPSASRMIRHASTFGKKSLDHIPSEPHRAQRREGWNTSENPYLAKLGEVLSQAFYSETSSRQHQVRVFFVSIECNVGNSTR